MELPVCRAMMSSDDIHAHKQLRPVHHADPACGLRRGHVLSDMQMQGALRTSSCRTHDVNQFYALGDMADGSKHPCLVLCYKGQA